MHPCSEVLQPSSRQLRHLGRTLLRHRLRTHRTTQEGGLLQSDRGRRSNRRAAGLPLGGASGDEERGLRRDDVGLYRNRGEGDDEDAQAGGAADAERHDGEAQSRTT